MNKNFLEEQLNSIQNAKKENRQRCANIVLSDKNLFNYLIEITFDVDNEVSIKAAWVLEWICTHQQLNWMIPHLDYFSTNIATLKYDSAIRPCAKICEHLAEAYFSKTLNDIQKKLTTKHIDAIVETGFDWLITPQKIAVRAYTMNTLHLFGLKKDWIHPELKHLIETKIIFESKGTKARGKHILNLIEKHQNSH